MHILITAFFLTIVACNKNNTQSTATANGSSTVLPDCEWCGALEAPADINWKTTIAPHDEPGERITISGIVYRSDKKTPAEDVIIYVYNTNAKGIYAKKGNETGNGKRHGYIRGWMKTGADGKYEFTTVKPAAYPNTEGPAHIHITVKEENKDEYWLEEYNFNDDPNFIKLIASKTLNAPEQDYFSYVIYPERNDKGELTGKRDLLLK
ncbi:MAG: intradiol ring-cleavage dioxygenase [Fimbriimonadaceae bacterium]|nr:intradiol ring-cleavage dioxygenase [Chitinophagales bacterium]